MSCHSRAGYRSAARLAAAVTGVDRRQVEKLLHGLRREASGVPLPEPSQEQLDEWYAESLVALDSTDLTPARKDALAEALREARTEPTTGRDFYVQQYLADRVRQQQIVDHAPGLVTLDAPGSQAAEYVRGEDGRPAKVWYASFGSNLYFDRMNVYIQGGSPNNGRTQYVGARDKTPIEDSVPAGLPGTVYYAGESSVWTGGPAFLDTSAAGRSLGRAHLITAEQFDDTVYQESNSGDAPDGSKVDLNQVIADGKHQGKGIYGTLVHVGDYQGALVVTFTSPVTVGQAMSGELVYSTDNKVEKASDRVAAREQQQKDLARETLQAKTEGREPKKVQQDWPIYGNQPSESYRAMITGGLQETFGLPKKACEAYFKGSMGWRNPPPAKPE